MAQVGQKPLIFHGAADRAFGYETGLHIASDHPEIDAAMTFNDLVALGVLAELSQAQLGTMRRQYLRTSDRKVASGLAGKRFEAEKPQAFPRRTGG